MAQRKKHTPEQVVAKLRKAEQMQAQGKTIAEICKVIGVTDQTFFRWRLKFGAMDEAEAKRLKLLESENARLKKIVAEQALDIDMLKELQRGKMVSPARRRDAVAYLVKLFRVSERRACRVVDQNRSTQRYEPCSSDEEVALVQRMRELAEDFPQWGARPLWIRLRAEGWRVGKNRIERLYKKEGLRVKVAKKGSGKKATGNAEGAVWVFKAEHPNHVWAWDFVSGGSIRGRDFRVLNIVDEFTRRNIGSTASWSFPSTRVIECLEEAFRRYGKPGIIRSDNGREFIADTVVQWLKQRGVEMCFIEKGRPQQNGFIERFNGTMRVELLNIESFHTLTEAQVMLDDFTQRYNGLRPHRGLGMRTPNEYTRMAWRERSTEGRLLE